MWKPSQEFTVMIRFSARAPIDLCYLKRGRLFETGLLSFFEKQQNVQNKTLLNICYKRDNNRNCNNNKYTIYVQLKWEILRQLFL